MQVIGLDFTAARPAHQRGIEIVTAHMLERDRRLADRPLVTPGAQCLQDEVKVTADLTAYPPSA